MAHHQAIIVDFTAVLVLHIIIFMAVIVDMVQRLFVTVVIIVMCIVIILDVLI